MIIIQIIFGKIPLKIFSLDLHTVIWNPDLKFKKLFRVPRIKVEFQSPPFHSNEAQVDATPQTTTSRKWGGCILK